MFTRVVSLSTEEERIYHLTPHEAVRAAWQLSNGYHPTVCDRDDKAPTVVIGEKSVACGDWCALT